MLLSLTFLDFFLIRRFQGNIHAGFTVLTGETGSGKSLFLQALKALLGEKVSCPGAILIGECAVSPSLSAWLDEHGIESSDTLIIRTVIQSKTRFYLNDQSVTRSLVQELAERLFVIQGQFDTASFDARDAVDRFTARKDPEIRKLKKELSQAYASWKIAQQERVQFEEEQLQWEKERGWAEQACREFESIQPLPDEELSLQAERETIAHDGRQAQLYEQALTSFEGFKDLLSNSYALQKILDRLDSEPIRSAMHTVISNLGDIKERLRESQERVLHSKERLEAIDDRSSKLRSLARQYKTNDLFAFWNDLQNQKNHCTDSTDLLEKERKAKDTLDLISTSLYKKRSQAAQRLDMRIQELLQELKLESMRFQTQGLWGDLPSPQGYDRWMFRIAPNHDDTFVSLNDIASGGERSRIQLALQTLLGDDDPKIFVFDEIDSGVSGSVASSMGQKMRQLSKHHQVLSITHSPQVASYADNHLFVEKTINASGAETDIQVCLTSDQRIEAITALLSGEVVSEEARSAAIRLLHEAKKSVSTSD